MVAEKTRSVNTKENNPKAEETGKCGITLWDACFVRGSSVLESVKLPPSLTLADHVPLKCKTTQ